MSDSQRIHAHEASIYSLNQEVERQRKEILELKRTRDEEQSRARVEGYRAGQEAVVAQLRAQKLVVEIKYTVDTSKSSPVWR